MIITKCLVWHRVPPTWTFVGVLPPHVSWFHTPFRHRAYKKLALRYHPDKNPDDRASAEIHFKRLNEAYGILHDAKRRKTYEQCGKHDDTFFQTQRFTDDLFTAFFGRATRTPPKPPYPKGSDVIPYGTNVKLFGLHQAHQHNGATREVPTGWEDSKYKTNVNVGKPVAKTASIVDYDAHLRRYQVRLTSGFVVSLKPTNFTQVQNPSPIGAHPHSLFS